MPSDDSGEQTDSTAGTVETAGEVVVIDDLDLLLAALPPRIRAAAQERGRANLLEIVLDLGRLPEARYPEGAFDLGAEVVSSADLAYVVEHVGEFGEDNRAGIGGTLHRISALRNRRGGVVGLTCRVGRAVRGTVALIRDVVEAGRSILILGRPGVGKTTLLREAARVLADELGKRVVVVDTSNEIAGDGDVPHPGIGRARRLQVARPAAQHGVMIEAVENHMPEVIIIDEIGTELEAAAARTIAERGVQLVGTAHGRTLENLLVNPTLSDLVGGIQAVTLGDEEARRRGTQKTVLERKAPPTFDVLVEQQSWREVIVHREVATAVDELLRGRVPSVEHRTRDDDDRIHTRVVAAQPSAAPAWSQLSPSGDLERALLGGRRRRGRTSGWGQDARQTRMLDDPRHVRPAAQVAWEDDEPGEEFDLEVAEPTGTSGRLDAPSRSTGISRDRLEESARQLQVPVEISNDQDSADAVITIRTYYRRQADRLRAAESERKPIYILRTNTVAQMQQCLARIFDLRQSEEGHASGLSDDPAVLAMQEAEDAASLLLTRGGGHVDLAPANAYVRRLQHQVAERYNLESRSYGKEPNRRVKLFAP
jgi:stage III sporulation protein SpoIIIAA